MPDTRDPEHVFRVERCDGGLDFIEADDMAADQNGIIRLFIRDPGTVLGTVLGTLVAVIPPHPGLSVIRVANLMTMEGLD